MNASISKARVLTCTCIEKSAPVVCDMSVEIYRNLIRADECNLSDDDGRKERQFYQREAIVGCRVLIGVLEAMRTNSEIEDIYKKTEEVLCMTASWKNKERKQTALRGGA